MSHFSGKSFALMLSLLMLTFAGAIPMVYGRTEVYNDPSWTVVLSVDADPATKMVATVTTTNDWEWGATFRRYGPYTTEAEVDTLIAAGVWSGLTPDYETEDAVPGSSKTTFVSEVSIGLPDLGWWYVEVDCHGIEEGTVYPHVAFGKLGLGNPVPWFTSLPFAMLAAIGAVVLLRKKGHLKVPF